MLAFAVPPVVGCAMLLGGGALLLMADSLRVLVAVNAALAVGSAVAWVGGVVLLMAFASGLGLVVVGLLAYIAMRVLLPGWVR